MLSFAIAEDDGGLPVGLPPDGHSRISFPTCEDLGIPHDQAMTSSSYDETNVEISFEASMAKPVSPENSSFKINTADFDTCNPKNPFSPLCRIPLPSPFGCYEYGVEPAFIRKRNERERDRVRCVNEGYAKLRQHLPLDNKDRRISKVETLRSAIKYIDHLQNLLRGVAVDTDGGKENAGKEERRDAENEAGVVGRLPSRKRSREISTDTDESGSPDPESTDFKRLCCLEGRDELDTDSD